MPSFDIVSEIDKHELTNALDNSKKELERRFDLRGKCTIEVQDKSVILTVEADFMLEQVLDIIRVCLIKRKINLDCLQINDSYLSGKIIKQEISFKEGLDKEDAKKIITFIKNIKLKVQVAINGDKIRITGKKRDDLQDAITKLKAENFSLALQFNNFRD